MIYSKTCQKCKHPQKQKPHSIYLVNIRKGVKLKCLICGHVKSRYTRTKLIEWKEPTAQQDIAKPKGTDLNVNLTAQEVQDAIL